MSWANGIPVWLVALLLAVASPLLVRLYADHLEKETARRTRRFVERLATSEGVDEVKGTPRE